MQGRLRRTSGMPGPTRRDRAHHKGTSVTQAHAADGEFKVTFERSSRIVLAWSFQESRVLLWLSPDPSIRSLYGGALICGIHSRTRRGAYPNKSMGGLLRNKGAAGLFISFLRLLLAVPILLNIMVPYS